MQLTNQNAAVYTSTVKALTRTMEAAGWEVNFVDIDLTRNSAVADIRITRFDGLWLHARVDSLGRCSMESFHRSKSLGMSRNVRGRQPLSPQVDDVFLGRRRFDGPRVMLRELCNYLVANAINPVSLSDVRNAWRGVMSEPVRVLPAAA